MSLDQETNALRALRTEADNLSDLAKSIYAAVTKEEAKKPRVEAIRRPTVLDNTRELKPVGT